MAVVNHNGSALGYASEDIRGYRYIVMTAVNQDGRALNLASYFQSKNR